MKGLFGTDLFCESVQQDMGGAIANKYIAPPFSILNTQDKRWQARKRQWVSLGLKSEIGRSSKMTYQIGDMSEHQKKEKIKEAKKKAALNTPGRGSLSNKTAWKDFSSKKYNENLDPKSKRALSAYSVFGDTTLDRNTGGITGTSIFDPVLCELMYKWFCPKGGQVLDPFAGGSVRGIIATVLGLRYYGIDLRQEQIDANHEQAIEIFGKVYPPAFVRVKISHKSLLQEFTKCTPEYIINNCKGRCCYGSDGLKVTIHKTEKARISLLGAEVSGDYLVPSKGGTHGECPFITSEGLCSIHDQKPFGCAASPFTLNRNNTLIVRNRYRLLKCYRNGENKVPAYIAHRYALESIFGDKETKRIIKHVKKGKDYHAKLDYQKYRMLVDNDTAKNHKEYKTLLPHHLNWIAGDSLMEVNQAPKCDFILTCPPYGDLEIYSDDPRDLSNMSMENFDLQYSAIIRQSALKLRDNRFACFVVGDYRNKGGMYTGFIAKTIKYFEEQGLHLYNEFILKNAIGSLPVRIQLQFDSYRKIGKMHQNVLVFYKGDNPKDIKNLNFMR